MIIPVAFPFNTVEGQGAPQNSFVSIRLADSNSIGSTKFTMVRPGHMGYTTYLRYG